MPEREYYTERYRYGFNGMHKENEIKGTNNSLDFGSRFYDPRLAIFQSTDPLAKKFPYQTPYAFANNTPIQAKDEDGKFANLIAKYGIEVGINVAMQMITSYMLDDKVKSWGDAWDKVSMWDAVTESAVDAIGPGKLKMLGQAALGIFNYIDAVGLENVTSQGLLEAGLTDILMDKLGNMDASAFKKGLQKLGIDAGDLKKMDIDAKLPGKLEKSPTGKGTVPPSQRDPKRVPTAKEKKAQWEANDKKCANCDKETELNDITPHHYPTRHADGGKATVPVCKTCHKELHKK